MTDNIATFSRDNLFRPYFGLIRSETKSTSFKVGAITIFSSEKKKALIHIPHGWFTDNDGKDAAIPTISYIKRVNPPKGKFTPIQLTAASVAEILKKPCGNYYCKDVDTYDMEYTLYLDADIYTNKFEVVEITQTPNHDIKVRFNLCDCQFTATLVHYFAYSSMEPAEYKAKKEELKREATFAESVEDFQKIATLATNVANMAVSVKANTERLKDYSELVKEADMADTIDALLEYKFKKPL